MVAKICAVFILFAVISQLRFAFGHSGQYCDSQAAFDDYVIAELVPPHGTVEQLLHVQNRQGGAADGEATGTLTVSRGEFISLIAGGALYDKVSVPFSVISL